MTNPPLRCVVSVSGFRGVIGHTLDPQTVMGLATAFAGLGRPGRIVLGRDSRPSGPLLSAAVTAGLLGCGCDMIDLGVVPTPTVPLMVRKHRARGGIQISASHNPGEWNALKFFDRRGRNIDQPTLDRLLSAYRAGAPTWRASDALGSMRRDADAIGTHLARILPLVDRERIAASGLSVLIDSVNGAGAELAAALMDALGCRLLPLHADPDRDFPRDPEPTAGNLAQTCKLVRAADVDLAFVQDPDADRLAIIDGDGRYLGEEYTLVLCAAARFAAARAAGCRQPVACTNLSTSRMIEDVAAAHAGRVVRTRIGEAHVVDGMQAHDAVIGGEGNGGVIDPRLVWCRDSHIGMALILDHLAASGTTLGGLVAEIPAYRMCKEKLPYGRQQVAAALPDVRADPICADAEIDEQDGLKLSWPDRWVHLRASGTEPRTRIIAEAPTAAAARKLVARLSRIFERHAGPADRSEAG